VIVLRTTATSCRVAPPSTRAADAGSVQNGADGGDAGEPGSRLPTRQPWIRQLLACLLVFLLSTRLPRHLVAMLEALGRSGPAHRPGALGALAMFSLDGFGLICALYLCHTRLAGVRLWRCYPPKRLIPLSLHFLGLLWGLLSLAASGGSAG
jgi:hypothetical protein